MIDRLSRRGVRLEDTGNLIASVRSGGAKARSKKYPSDDDEHACNSADDGSPFRRILFSHGKSLMLSLYQVATHFRFRLRSGLHSGNEARKHSASLEWSESRSETKAKKDS